MRPSRARSSAPAASCHMLSSVDCITTTSESEFSVHTGGVQLRRLPTLYWRREFPQAGGLMSYGSSLADAIPESFLARADEVIE
jgi:hypothetical protein